MLQGKFEKGMTAVQMEFFADVGAMFFYGSQADEKLFANFFAGKIFGNEFQDAPFCSGQVVDRRLFLCKLNSPTATIDQKRSQGVARVMFARGDGFNAFDNVAQGAVFQDKTFGAKINRFIE